MHEGFASWSRRVRGVQHRHDENRNPGCDQKCDLSPLPPKPGGILSLGTKKAAKIDKSIFALLLVVRQHLNPQAVWAFWVSPIRIRSNYHPAAISAGCKRTIGTYQRVVTFAIKG